MPDEEDSTEPAEEDSTEPAEEEKTPELEEVEKGVIETLKILAEAFKKGIERITDQTLLFSLCVLILYVILMVAIRLSTTISDSTLLIIGFLLLLFAAVIIFLHMLKNQAFKRLSDGIQEEIFIGIDNTSIAENEKKNARKSIRDAFEKEKNKVKDKDPIKYRFYVDIVEEFDKYIKKK
ncbi:MAG: hypothetical protein ACFFDN_18575 [Candidatus Hodarchaeota archaeon]